MVEKDRQGIGIPQTIHAIHTAADMLLIGKKIAQDSMKKFPFVPEPESFGNRIWEESGVDFWSVTGEQRYKIAAHAKFIYELMLARAELQRIWVQDPEQVKRNILATISWDTEGELQLDPSLVNIKWGLFSFALVAEKEAYEDIKRVLCSPGENYGFVTGRLTGPLGEVPVVLGGKEWKQTLWHEDMHVLQSARGELERPFDVREEIIEPEILRAVNNEDIRPRDLDACKKFLTGLCANAKYDFNIELRTSIWHRSVPSIRTFNEGSVDLALTFLLNVIYAPATDLTDKQKIRESYKAIFQIAKVDYYQELLWSSVLQAVKNHKEKGSAWEWAASRATALPINSSPRLIQAVLLGRKGKLEKEPEVNAAIPLPQALIIHARKTIYPDSYGQGEGIKKDKIEEFWKILVDLYTDRSLYREICKEYDIDKEDMQKVKQKLIEYAAKSVPPGLRRKTKRRLTERLK
jgi:hypothetical protein